jgi:RimK family alpha-L-glutamate ligase
MRFFALYTPTSDSDARALLLKKSCEEKGIEFITINPQTFDFTAENPLQPGDALYRIAPGKAARVIERFLMRDDIATLYQNNDRTFFESDNILLYKKHGVPVPKTIPYLRNDREFLKKAVEYLGGFPVILKAMGGSHGVGVMRVDSFPSLFSIADVLNTWNQRLVMKQYIDNPSHARLIVLGDEVIDSIRYTAQGEDFRSNVGAEPQVAPEKFAPEVEAIAIQAVRAIGTEFGGVDILLDKNGGAYVAETNFPCYFPRAQKITGTDISGKMIDHLMKKSERLLKK